MRILVLGAAGMAGHIVYGVLKASDNEVVAHARTSESFRWADYVADLSEHHIIDLVLREAKPDVVVNCVGMLVEASQRRPDLATYINAYLPRTLERLGPEVGFRTIHLSTDCVFTGKTGNYTECSVRDETKPYGLSKSLGELNNDRDCTIRTSIVGPELKDDGTGLFEWFFRQSGKVYGYENAYWNGVTTLDLAVFVDRVIQEGVTGLAHITSLSPVSKMELLESFKSTYDKQIDILPRTLDTPVNKTLQITRVIPYIQRPIAVQLEDLKRWYEEHGKWLNTSA